MPENKKYIIEIPGMNGADAWDADRWERNAAQFSTDNPDANVFEVDTYNPEDEQEGDQYMISIPGYNGADMWDSDRWSRNKEQFMADHPDAQIQRVRLVNYWEAQAKENRAKREALKGSDEERKAKLAELGYYDDTAEEQDFAIDWRLKPVSSAMKTNSVSGETTITDGKLAEFYANDTEHTEQEAEKARLDAEYDANPWVIEQREYEQERRNYINSLMQEIDELSKGVDKIAAGKYRAGALNDMPMSPKNYEKGLEAYNKESALVFAKTMLQDAETLRSGLEYRGGKWASEKDAFARTISSNSTWNSEEYQEGQQMLLRTFQKLQEHFGSLNEWEPEEMEKVLTPEEMQMVNAFFELSAAEAETAGKTSQGFNVGRGWAANLPFMLEFLTYMGVSEAMAGPMAQGLTKAAAKTLARKAGASLVKRAANTATRQLTRAGIGAAKAAVIGATQTLAQGTTQTQVRDAMLSFDDNGYLTDDAKTAAVAYFDKAIENFSEATGDILSGIIGTPLKGGLRALNKAFKTKAFTNIASAITESVPNKILKFAGWNGLFGELGEEVVGALIRDLTISDGNLKHFFEKENLLETILTFLPMTVFGGAFSLGQLGYAKASMSSAESRMRSRLTDYISKDQLDYIISETQSTTPEHMAETMMPVIQAMAQMGAGKKEIEAVRDYMVSAARYQSLMGVQEAKNTAEKEAFKASLEKEVGKFYHAPQVTNKAGETMELSPVVRTVTLKNGKTVYAVSQTNEAGEFLTIDVKTGEQGIAKESDVSEFLNKDGKMQKSSITESLNEFLTRQVMLKHRETEADRMSQQYNEQVAGLQELLKEKQGHINLGTEGAPYEVLVDSTTEQGVKCIAPDGSAIDLTWEQVGDALGQPIKLMTDQQIVDNEIADIARRAAERKAELARRKGTAESAEGAVIEAEKAQAKAEEDAKHIPMNPDGTVNETAFWEQDPEGYTQWNDEQNQDNGADSLRQIAASKQALLGQLSEAQKAAQTSVPADRKAAEREIARLQERIARMEALEAKYAEKKVAPFRERAMKWKELTKAPVYIIETEDELKKLVKGIDQMTGESRVRGLAKDGKAYIYLPGIVDVAEIDAVFMHEAVAHVGLKGMLGEKMFNELLGEVWEMMSPTARRVFMSYPGVNADYLAAADEYVAHIAEKMGAGIADAEEQTIWQKIVGLVRKFLRAIGIELKMTEEELSSLLHQAYANLAENMAKAEQMGKSKAKLSVEESAPSAAQQEYAALAEDLTAEEIKAVAMNDYTAAQEAYDALAAEVPKVNAGESAKDFIARKKAYNEQVTAAKAELDARQALLDEIARMENEEMPVEEPEIVEDLEETVQYDGSLRLSMVTYHDWTDNLGHAHKGTRTQVLERMIAMNFSDAEINDMMRRMDAMYEYMDKLRALTNEDGSVRFDEFNAWAEKTPLYKQVGRDFVKAITSLVSNGDYPINMELTTDCIKREAFTMLLNTLIKRGADLSQMGPGEIVTIQKMMNQYGIEVACKLCFVEGERLQIVNWASQIVEDWNNALIEAGVETDEYFEFGKDGDAFIPAEEWRTHENKSEVAKMLRQLKEIELLFQGIDPAQFKKQKAKNKRALEKYKKEKSEAWAKRTKKPASQWKPSDEAKAEMKKIANEGLAPSYVNENMEEYRNAFNAMRNEWLDKHPGADPLSFTPTKKQWEALGKIRNRQIDTVRAKMVRLIMEYPEMRKKMTLNDLLGSKGLMEIRQQHGQAYADLYSIILQRFGTATPKPVQDAAPYDGELMTLSEDAFKKANEIGGARLFSFSDFDITKVFDYMQMFFDLEANRQMLQSYTKEVAAVIIFGRSNAKFNISTLANAYVPQEVLEEYAKAKEKRQKELKHKWSENAGLIVDEAGNITGINFSEEHSVSPAFAQQIFHDEARNKDCGAIMVGASVNHAIYSAAQDWIRMVIPFHLSGMPKAARDKTDVKWYFDNTPFQSTRKMTKDGWSKISSSEDTFKFYDDMNQPGWNMRDKTKQYLAWCKEHGYRPKFDWGINSDYYRAYCEEQGYEPNQQIIDIMDADTTDGVWNQYYKFLTDFTAYKPVFNEQGEMIDEIPSPQLPVQSNFDFSEMEKEVLFEGEKSMLGHREENIKKAERHMDALAAQVVPYLNGEITEDEMGLKDNVFYKSSTDAENYLEALAEQQDTRLSAVRESTAEEEGTEKALNWIGALQTHLGTELSQQELSTAAKVVKDFVNPNLMITPEQDKAYKDAVERGDMETAQRMVLEAAKLAMPNTKVVDENGNPKVVYHQTNAKVYVNRETGQNWDELNWKEKMEWDERDDWEDYWEEQDFNTFSRVNARTTNEFDGFFFAPKYDEYHEYGERTISAFVNIQNPASREDYNIDSRYSDAGRAERIRLQEAGFDGVIRMEGEEVDEYIAFEPSQIKSAEAVTYDDNGNVIPLSERFNPENSDIRFSVRTDEQREQLFDAAKARFGLTNNFKVAGYMLPDGSLLDFSEANDGGDPNQRTLDHREIEGIIMDEGKEYDSRWMYLADFMNEGAIRLLPEYAGINLMHAPTKEQRQRLMDFIYKYNGEVILEIADERLNNVAYVEYDRRTSPSRIFRDIDGYFNEGIIPQQDVRFSAVQITPEVREEMEVIKATALVDGKLGLAPNGKKSKLTEDQWALVRTRRFKEYFGDWENDPENASKVIDPETGEPMVVYHGTPNEFTVFGEDTSSKQAHTYEDTFYFMDNEEVAASYGELMPCFVNLRNPMIVDFEGGSWRGEKTEIAVQYDRTGATLQGGFKSIEEAEAWREQFLADNPAYAADADYVRAKESAVVAMGTSSDEYTQQAKEEGYDGCIFRNISDAASLEHVETLVTDVVAFAPEQVKSAVENTGEYSPENKDIRYSIRQEGQSAEDFFNQTLESYKAKYKPTAPIELVEPTREFLEGLWGSEFVDEEFKNRKRTHGIYDRDSDKIYIFAKDDIITTLMIDDVLFHESIHALLTNNKKFLDLGAWLWENTGSEKSKRSRLKRDILKDYSEEDYHEEMLATMLGECMAIGKVQELASLLPEYERGLLETILNEIGYDIESETRSRLRLSGRELEAQSLFYANAKSREAEEGGAESAGGEAGLRYSVRTKPAPEKTQPVYKLMRLGEDGKLYPLFIGSAEAIELGTWYDADSPNLGDLTKLPSGIHLVSNDTGEAMTFEQFKAEHPEIEIKGKRPNVAAVNWATANGMRWIEIEDKATAQRRYEGESRSYYNLGINGSGQVGQFAMRPGWHAGSLPSMRQIGKGKDKNLRDDSFVWVRGRVPADVDYQAEADANPDKDIPTHIPTDGFYMKATNANKKASQADKIGWYVAGSFIADEIISDAEARRVIDEWNAGHADAKVEYDYPRESGKDFDPAEGIRLSVVSTPVDQVMEISALKGLRILAGMNLGLEGEMTMVEDMIASERSIIKRLQKKEKTPLVEQQIKNAENRLKVNLRQLEILEAVKDSLIDTSEIKPDYDSALADMEPQSAFEYLSRFFTMSHTPQIKVVGEDGKEVTIRQVRKKNGVMLSPETLKRELGWSKSDWSGLKYIVSAKEGMSIDAIAEMIQEDSEAAQFFAGMDTMQIKDVVIDFLMSMETYADIRDYIKNERMRLAEEQAADANNRKGYRNEQLEAEYGMSIEQYNEMLIQQAREDRERWLEEAENPEEFTKFEQAIIDEYGNETIDETGTRGTVSEGAREEEGTSDKVSADDGRTSSESESVDGIEDDGDLPEGNGPDNSGGGRGPGNGGGSRRNDTRTEGEDSEPGVVSTETGTSEKTVDEIVESGKQKVLEENAAAADVFIRKLYEINGELAKLRRAAAAQREYDKNTVQIITRLANELLENGALSDVTRYEIKRILSVINGAVGRNDLTVSVDRLMDIMIGNQLRYGRNRLDEFMKIRGKKVDARGVEVRGRLDIEGQAIMDAMREGVSLDIARLEERIAEAEDRLTDASETVRRNAENDLVGYQLAKRYLEEIKESEAEEKDLRKELKDAGEVHKAGQMTDEAYKEFKKSTYDAIRENRMHRVEAYEALLSDMADMIQKSIKNAGQLREAEKARVENIHHMANSDLQGMPASAHEQKVSRFWNNPIVKLFTAPLATFEQWLKLFGQKSAEGKGYLYNYFVGAWNKANNAEYLGVRDAHAILDAKVKEVFGRRFNRWSDLFTIDKKLPKMKISMWDDGAMREFEVTQGNLLYIYMVNKMTDGKMKLRKMGITEETIDAFVKLMDPRFIQLADWMQDEFLPGIRDKYNAVHERMFGAPMAAIDSYFPIKVNANARTRDVELGTDTESGRPSSITGSIIKRTKNSLALDVLGSNAFDVILEHIEQMEHWAAFAEFNRDLNTLLSYRLFRNRVQNMSTAYGSGKEAWNSFKETAEIVAGVYRPKTSGIDKALTNAVRGFTAGKINFRLWTALKQTLSMPAFLAYANPATFAKNIATPWEAWNWAMENLPAFEKRWKSREAGNVRLKKTEADWALWQSNAMEAMARWGMTPNAFVDAVTCSIGAKSVYDTMYARYIKDGYSHEKADEKAKLDATTAFNATQQSSESAFLSAIQSDRAFVAHMATVFRNNSFGMGRELVSALRQTKDRMKDGFKEESIEFMKKQMMRDGLTEEQATRAADRAYRNSAVKDAARIALFGFGMQFLWNLGGSAVYLLFGDDDEEKRQMVKDAALRGAFGSFESLSFGNLVPEMAASIASGNIKNFHPSLSPAGSDIASLWNEMLKDPVAGTSELVNILMQAGFGVNPQVLTNTVVAIVDACDGDMELSKEVGIALLRVLQAPQSNIDKLIMDEIDFTKDKGLDITIDEFAKNYADYKKRINAPVIWRAYSDENEKKIEDKYIKRFQETAKELKRTRGSEEAQKYYQYVDEEYKEVGTTLRDLKKKVEDAAKQGDNVTALEYAERIEEFTQTPEFEKYSRMAGYEKAIQKLSKAMKDVSDKATKERLEDKMLELRKEMVEELEKIEGTEQ